MAARQGQELSKAAEEVARLQPVIDNLTAKGNWVVVVVVFDQPAIPDIFGQAAGWTEEKDIKKFVHAYLRYGRTYDDAYNDRGAPTEPQLRAATLEESVRVPRPLPRKEAGRTWVEALWKVVSPVAETGDEEPERRSAAEEFSGRWTSTGEKLESSLEIVATEKSARVSTWWAGGQHTVDWVRWNPAEGTLQVGFSNPKAEPGWARVSTFRVVGPGMMVEEFATGYPAAGKQGLHDTGRRWWSNADAMRRSLTDPRRLRR